MTDGFSRLNIVRVIVLTDFEVINKAFKNPAISSRPSSDEKIALENLTQERASGLPQYADNIGLKTGNTTKALESSFRHIGLD